MEEEGEPTVKPIVVQRPTVSKTPMRIDTFLQNRELASNKRIVRTFNADFAKNDFCQKDIREHTGCVNSVQFSHGEQLLATGGDDLRSRIWRVDDLMLQKTPKPIMKATEGHTSNIFSLEFDLEERNIFSGERRGCILKHDIETSQCAYATESQRRTGDVYSLHHHPFDAHVILVAHAHSISILDDRDQGRQTSLLTTDYHRREFFSAEFHPISPVLMLINGESDGPNVYDRRNPSAPFYDRTVFTGLPNSPETWMGASWSPSGNQFMAIRRTSTPLYFDVRGKFQN
ncbi:hypothetical protein CAEBREN_18893 [Caenorhabditis brenneri]|uniref:Uncharacterized protein n=1 Tax=Caenorhabditis brenneri TaxID=135651 RepID=G0MTY7_CAEBE|nr:hypothetical protein CAEBREN_18893 [Caenorhabditis brenneri]